MTIWYVYLLKCQDNAIYTGVTTDIDRRFQEHVHGKGGHYTNYNRPEGMLYKEPFGSKVDAEKRERQIKRWSRLKKLALINGDKLGLMDLSKSRD